mgnify:CR=1 FL=1|tara:strand:+ start:211 stop:738 length:528 start_codon:yes stop_codon:yes gene_type:complete
MKTSLKIDKSQLNKSLSGEDIHKLIDCNVLTYSDLHRHKTIESILGKHKKAVLLYHTSASYGHWTTIYEYNNTIFFFDSYGSKLDSQLKYLNENLREDLKSNHTYLSQLLYNSNKKVEYNQYQFQSKSPGIATCGRWSIHRLKHPDISIEEYHKIFKEASKYIDKDVLVCKLVPL